MIRRLRLWLSFRRTLIATVVARTDQRDDYREHALEAIKNRDFAFREAAVWRGRAERAERELETYRRRAQDALR